MRIIGLASFFSLFVFAFTPVFAMSGDGCGGECASCHSLSVEEASGLLKDVGQVKSVQMSGVRGLYELALEKDGQQGVLYMDFGKKRLMSGQIFDLATRKVIPPVSAAAAVPAPQKVEQSKIPLEPSLVMGNPKGSKKLFVFTDPDCPYCGKLHDELKQLVTLEPNLAIYIKLFPLKMHPHAFDKARVIMGRKSLALLEQSFKGEKLPAPGVKDPAQPVADALKYAETLGIRSTPTLILPDGQVLLGVKTAKVLQQLLDKK